MRKLLMIVAMVAVIGMAGTAAAGIVYNYVGDGVQDGATVDPGVSSTDLLNGLTGVVTGQPAHGISAPIGVVTDGLDTVPNVVESRR